MSEDPEGPFAPPAHGPTVTSPGGIYANTPIRNYGDTILNSTAAVRRN
jgi:hypothetical protein